MSKLEAGGPAVEALPDDLCLDPEGHATDAILACIADGEAAIVPAAALSHVEGCEACGARLGEAALLSMGATEALVRLDAEERSVSAIVPVSVPLPAPSRIPGVATNKSVGARAPGVATNGSVGAKPLNEKRRPLPVAAIVAASIVALVTAIPLVTGAIGAVPLLITDAATTLPFVVRIGSAILRGTPWGHGGAALWVKAISAVVFVLAGLTVARRSERARTLRGGVG